MEGVKKLPGEEVQQTLMDILNETLIALTIPVIAPTEGDWSEAVKTITDQCAVDPTIPNPLSVITLPAAEDEILRVYLFIENDENGKLKRQEKLNIANGAVELVVFGRNVISIGAFVFNIPGNTMNLPQVVLYWDHLAKEWIPDVVAVQTPAEQETYRELRLMELARLPQVLSFLIKRLCVPV